MWTTPRPRRVLDAAMWSTLPQLLRLDHDGIGLWTRLVLHQVADARVEHRDDRDGYQGADDAGQDDAGRDRDDDRQRVERDRAAHDDRLEHVALELLHRDDADQHRQGGQGTAVDQRDQDRDRAGDGGADDGHERADE